MPEIYLEEWPPYSPNDLERRNGAIEVARLMMNAAFTAPKAGGVPQVEGHIVWGQSEQERIARKMEELAQSRRSNRLWRNMFKYEAVMVRESDAVLFLGNYQLFRPFETGCNLCGGVGGCQWFYERKGAHFGQVDVSEVQHPEWLIDGPVCGIRLQGFGLAVGSALEVATRLHVDARPLSSVGIAGQKLGYCPKSPMVVGIPIAAQSKSPYVDILPDYHIYNLSRYVDAIRRQHVITRMVHWFDYRNWDVMAELEQGKSEEGEGK